MITDYQLGLMRKFEEYAMYDEVGDLVGIKENAPTDAVKAYTEFMDYQESAHEHGVKI